MAIAAQDAADRVEQLIILTERLTQLIALEASAFEQRRPHEAAKYVEETSRLANIYRHESARVRADPSLVSGAPLDQRTALKRATEAFDAVLARQSRAIERRAPSPRGWCGPSPTRSPPNGRKTPAMAPAACVPAGRRPPPSPSISGPDRRQAAPGGRSRSPPGSQDRG
jgi:hypothetical protein